MSLLFNLRAFRAVDRISNPPKIGGFLFLRKALLYRCIWIERTDITIWF